MIGRTCLIVVVGLAIGSCGTNDSSQSTKDVSGVYVREYTFKILNPEKGNEIGMRSVRDTITIRYKDDDFEITNKKWKLNDYDNEGWQNMAHSDDRPLPTYRASLSNTDNSLNPVQQDVGPSLYFESSSAFHIGKDSKKKYSKVEKQ